MTMLVYLLVLAALVVVMYAVQFWEYKHTQH